MREEPFDNTKSPYESDDIKYALDYNGLGEHLENIEVIVAEVCGENDGYSWHWILRMKDGTYRYATGGCDYTGWDCQSHATIGEPRENFTDALADAPVEDSRPRIRETLKEQILGAIPFATYISS